VVDERAAAVSKMLKGGRWASRAHGIQISDRIMTPPEEPFQCNGTRFALDADRVAKLLASGIARVIDR
jgi:hypothetical protein